jgi:hypothetical protein
MKNYGLVDVYIYIYIYIYIHGFETSALVGGEWSPSHPGPLTPGSHWIGGWMGPRTGLEDMENRKFLPLRELELQCLGRPARTQLLYRLTMRYPG